MMPIHSMPAVSDSHIRREPDRPSSLYELEEQLSAMLDSAELITPEQEEQFCRELQHALKNAVEKRDRVGQFMAHLEAQVAFADVEIERLKYRKKIFDHALDRLKSYLGRIIEALGKDHKGQYRKLEGRTVTFSLVRCPASVEVRDEPEVPLAYKAVTLTIHAPTWHELLEGMEEQEKDRFMKGIASTQSTINKRDIKKAIDAGEKVPGVELVTSRTWLKRS